MLFVLSTVKQSLLQHWKAISLYETFTMYLLWLTFDSSSLLFTCTLGVIIEVNLFYTNTKSVLLQFFFSRWKVCKKYSQRKSSESREIWGNVKGHWGLMMSQLPQVSSFSSGMWSWMGTNGPTSPFSSPYPLRSAQVVMPSCSRSSPPLSRPAWSRSRSSWNWSMTWAPSRPCPPCRAPTRRARRSAPWKTSQSPSRRPLPCLQVCKRAGNLTVNAQCVYS